jgi:hypothetical protein
MRENNVPLTKDNYMEINYLGQPPPEGVEAEENLPPEIKYRKES